MPPPGGQPATPTRRSHVDEKPEPIHARVQQAMKSARSEMEAFGLHLSANKLNRLVRAYLAADDLEQTFGQWVISYADPTGETAARNVDRPRRAA